MRYYFQLQTQRIYRKVADWGIHPVLGLIIGLISVWGGGYYSLSNYPYAGIAYVGIGIMLIQSVSNTQDKNTLKLIFTGDQLMRIRLIENLFLAILLSVPLMAKFLWLETCVLVGASGLISLILINNVSIPHIPSPFYRWPFEFSVGFRRWFWVLIIPVFLVYKAVEVENFNLGLAGVGVVNIMALMFYLTPEPEYYVWIFKDGPKGFLSKKIIIGCAYTVLLVLPFLIVLFNFFPEERSSLVVFAAIALAYVPVVISSKYASFPKEIGLPQAIIIGFTLYLPLVLIFVIPAIFYYASNRLKTYLK